MKAHVCDRCGEMITGTVIRIIPGLKICSVWITARHRFEICHDCKEQLDNWLMGTSGLPSKGGK